MDDDELSDPTLASVRFGDAPPVRTNEDLRQRWRALMGPWGFSGDSIWVSWYAADGTQLREILQVEDCACEFEPRLVANLLDLAALPVHDGLAARTALLLSRPGPPSLSALDRRRVAALVHRAREVGLPMAPVHLATPAAVRVVSLDDLGSQVG